MAMSSDAIGPPFISDGFGNEWSLCDRQPCGLEVVRPGKVQCWCDSKGGALWNDERGNAS
jgi:hypothetical protein